MLDLNGRVSLGLCWDHTITGDSCALVFRADKLNIQPLMNADFTTFIITNFTNGQMTRISSKLDENIRDIRIFLQLDNGLVAWQKVYGSKTQINTDEQLILEIIGVYPSLSAVYPLFSGTTNRYPTPRTVLT